MLNYWKNKISDPCISLNLLYVNWTFGNLKFRHLRPPRVGYEKELTEKVKCEIEHRADSLRKCIVRSYENNCSLSSKAEGHSKIWWSPEYSALRKEFRRVEQLGIQAPVVLDHYSKRWFFEKPYKVTICERNELKGSFHARLTRDYKAGLDLVHRWIQNRKGG